jgi:hypothetical protein
MDDPAAAAKHLVDLARTHIENDRCRIIWQRTLMAKYERDDDVARLPVARFILERMQKHVAEMIAVHAAAEGLLFKLSANEASVEKVVCDTPTPM